MVSAVWLTSQIALFGTYQVCFAEIYFHHNISIARQPEELWKLSSRIHVLVLLAVVYSLVMNWRYLNAEQISYSPGNIYLWWLNGDLEVAIKGRLFFPGDFEALGSPTNPMFSRAFLTSSMDLQRL